MKSYKQYKQILFTVKLGQCVVGTFAFHKMSTFYYLLFTLCQLIRYIHMNKRFRPNIR